MTGAKYLKDANRLGIFFLILFGICFAWYFVNPVAQDLHLDLLRLTFFGYTDMDVLSFVWGAIQSYVWAYIFVGLWYLVSGRKSVA